jgi:hypothetical protein
VTPRDDAELSRRIHRAVDPLLPDATARQRVLESIRHKLVEKSALAIAPRRTVRARLLGVLMVLSAVALVAGAFGLGLSLRSQPHPLPAPAHSPPIPSKPPATPPGSPTPRATPSAVAYVQATSVSFASASDGWALGAGCDSQQRCALTIARTADSGATWALVSNPTGVDANGVLQVTAASSLDSWVWGTDANGQPVFMATHDGGRSWQGDSPGSASVAAAVVANGTLWARTTCAVGSSGCAAHLMSSPVRGGMWTDLGILPAAVQGTPTSGSGVATGSLIRSNGRAWVVGSNGLRNGIARTDDGGHTWVVLSLPCQLQDPELFMAASSNTHVMLACTVTGVLPAPQEVWSSGDGGSHWALESREGFAQISPQLHDVGRIGSSGFPDGLVVVNENTAWMMQGREDDLVTRDNGRTWTHAALPQTYFGQAGGTGGLTFADPLHGWTFTTAGLWGTTDGGVHWTYLPVIGRVPGY